jgi:dTDP-4-dehydrorhamnose reductase
MQPKDNLAWITGAGGLIGNYLVQTAPKFAPQWRVRALTRSTLDLLDFDAVHRQFNNDQPQLVIHCAGITSLAGAAADPKLARRLNVELTGLLAELAADSGFVFISTDLVFDGCKGNYAETDATNPLHLYGQTKVNAEQIILRNSRHLVVRTSLNGGISPTGDRGFNEKMKREWQMGRSMGLFADEFRNPIFAGETARAIWELANQNCAGIYHVAGAEKLSRWQIGQLLAKRWPEVKANIVPALAKDFPGPPRALDTTLNISKVQRALSKPLIGLTQWLAANPHEPF